MKWKRSRHRLPARKAGEVGAVLDAQCRLNAPPVFDGLIAADGCICLSLADSRVLCLGGK